MPILLELRSERDVLKEISYLIPNHFSAKLLDYSLLVKNDQQ